MFASPEPLPPSPLEEDLGWREPWSQTDDDSPHFDSPSSLDDFQQPKGKAKATEPLPTSYASGASQWPDQGRSTEAYPPTTDEATETRRVLENLRLWEVAERERRKSARESASHTSTSIVVDVARRASAFWSRRSSHHPIDGSGEHRALHTSEDQVRLGEILASPSPSVLPSPCPSPGPSSIHHPIITGTGPYTRRADDPFSDPIPGSSSSLFVNAQPTAEIEPASVELQALTSAAPLLSSHSDAVSHSGNRLSAKVVGAPAPLDLPKPRSPPPRTATPHAKRPPEPFPRPDSRLVRSTADEEEVDAKPVKWWTEWLCGCSEGPDRGGDVQAGRTNPME